MSVWLGLWWVWLAAALVFGLVEVLLPGFIFLGFAIAGIAMALLVLFVPDLSAAAALALFAVLALLAWVVLRKAFRNQSSGARIFTRDVNDD